MTCGLQPALPSYPKPIANAALTSACRAILTAVRRERARELLADPALDIDEVAFLLGFEDQNSFFRAFRLWEGETPSSWRAMHQNQGTL